MERITSRLLKYGTLISTYCLIGSVIVQIIARFTLEKAPAWTEEASRFFFIYAISFAAGLAMKDQFYVQLDLFYDKFSAKTQRVLNRLIPLFIFLLFAIISIFTFQLMALGHMETSPSMGIKMSVAFFSILILSTSVAYYAFLDFRKIAKK